jgi:hypothetical protein
MKAILLAGILAVLFLLGVTLTLRLVKLQQPAIFQLRLWAACVPLLILVYLLTPANLWILPDALLDDPPWFGPLFCLGLWFAGFFGGILQLYNLTERGMSLRMLIDISQNGSTGMTAQEMMQNYSAGQGIVWMYQKRLDGLLEGRLVKIEAGVISNQDRGRRVATMFRRLRRLLRLGGWT